MAGYYSFRLSKIAGGGTNIGASSRNLETVGIGFSAAGSFIGENSIVGFVLGTNIEAATLSYGLNVLLGRESGCFTGGVFYIF